MTRACLVSRALAITLATALGAACAPTREAMIAPVSADVERRLGRKVSWRGDEADERQAAETRARLLDGTLRMDEAVQLALLENRSLQAAYEELGVSEAELLAAGLLDNPVFHAGAVFYGRHDGGDTSPDLTLSVEQDFLSILAIPQRRAAAEGSLAAARAAVTRSVVDVAAQARAAFVDAVTAEEVEALRRRATHAAAAALELVRRMHAAGNINDLTLVAEEARAKEAEVALFGAQRDAAVTKARLAAVLGVLDREILLPASLPDPVRTLPALDVEALAVERSLVLAGVRGEIAAEAARLGYASWSRFLPGLDVGAELERDDALLKAGPAVGLTLPLFDLGQGTLLASESRLRERTATLAFLSSQVRARTREAVAVEQAAAGQARALAELVPIQERVVEQTWLQYNGMFVGVFDLLDARTRAIDTAERSAQARRLAWRARIDVDKLLAGGTPEGAEDVMAGRSSTAAGARHGGH